EDDYSLVEGVTLTPGVLRLRGIVFVSLSGKVVSGVNVFMGKSLHDGVYYNFLADRGIKWYSSFVGSLED
ncbi:hypothetical protein U1Q18_017423, partial [Sarracenia purpurea var. burkii]